MTKLLTVSQIARELGRSVDWLREAERKGEIPKAKRDHNNWRLYSEEDLERLREVLIPGRHEQHLE